MNEVPLEYRVSEILRIYRMQPKALTKALLALVEAEVQKRSDADLRTAGEKVCKRKHPVASQGVACLNCVEAEMAAKEKELDLGALASEIC